MRRGSSLLAVVLMLSAGISLALAAMMRERTSIQVARNRVALSRSAWAAEDCVARAIAVIDDALGVVGAAVAKQAPRAPDSLPELLRTAPIVTECPGAVSLHPSGVALPVNLVGAPELRNLFLAAGLGEAASDSLADAIADWRDSDDVPRALGCEHACYSIASVPSPRNGRIVHVDELEWIRGFVSADSTTSAGIGVSLRSLLAVDDDRVSVLHAPHAVLASLPGIGPRGAVAILRRRRLDDWHPGSLQEIGALLVQSDADSLLQAATALGRLATVEPDQWILRAVAPRPSVVDAQPANGTYLELRLRLSANGAQLIRRSSGP